MSFAHGLRARSAPVLCMALAVAWASACASKPPPATPEGSPRYHVVRPGETAYSLANRYGVTVGQLAAANDLRNPNDLEVGQRLKIPGSTRTPIDTRENPWATVHPKGKTSERLHFMWPVEGRVTSGFGLRSGAHHDGIDILVPRGTRVHAAEAGRVVHSDNSLSGYGNTIIIKHTGNFSTVYAHNDSNVASVGDFVEKGDLIAKSGKTGRASAPHVHFEIRRDGSPRNPLEYLP